MWKNDPWIIKDPDKVEALKVMWDKGFSLNKIALELGWTRNQVAGLRWRMQLPSRPRCTPGRPSKPKPATKPQPVTVKRPPKPISKPTEAPEPEPVVITPPHPIQPTSDVASPGKGIMALGDSDCRWVVSEGTGPDAQYCGKPILQGHTFSYCRQHLEEALKYPMEEVA